MYLRTLIFCLLFLPFISNQSSAQSRYLRWIDVPPSHGLQGLYVLPHGEIVYQSNEQNTYFINHIDGNGNLTLSRSYPGSNSTFANTSTEAGGVNHDTLFAYDAVGRRIFHLDGGTGSHLTSYHFQHTSPLNFYLRDMIILDDGNALVLIQFSGAVTLVEILVKVRPDGTIVWQNAYDIAYYPIGDYLLEDDSGNLIAAGSNFDVNQSQKPLIMKTDANGNFAWTMELTPPGGTGSIGGIAEINNAYLLEVGPSGSPGTIITAVEKDGSGVKWAREFPAPSSIAVGPDQTIMVYTIVGAPDYENFLTRLDTNGNVVMQVNPQPFITVPEGNFQALACQDYAIVGFHTDSLAQRRHVVCRFDSSGSGFCDYGTGTFATLSRTVTSVKSTFQSPYTHVPFTLSNFLPLGTSQSGNYEDSILCRTSICPDSTTWTLAFNHAATGTSVAFTQTQGPASSWDWDFGDGSSSTQQNPTHTYNAIGSYLVCLTTTDSACCIQYWCDSVTVTCPDSSAWTVAFNQTSNGPTANFAHTQGSATSWNWDFGDGSSSSQQNPAHTYNALGDYLVCLSITDSLSCVQTVCDTVTIACLDSSAWTVAFSHATNGPTVNFTHTQGSATSWNWDFGDGSSSGQQNPAHSYTNSGTYTVCLTITDSLTCQETVCDTVNVIVIGLEDGIQAGYTELRYLSNGNFLVRWEGMPISTSRIKVFDLYGRLIDTYTVSGAQGELEFEMDLVAAGTYWLSFENETVRAVQRLVKM